MEGRGRGCGLRVSGAVRAGGGAAGREAPKAWKSLAAAPLARPLGLLVRGVGHAGRGGAGRTGAPSSAPAAPTELPPSPPGHIPDSEKCVSSAVSF